MNAPLRAVVATRLSKLTDASTSPDSQSTNGLKYAEAMGWKVVGEASDLDVSASVVGPWDRQELGAWLSKPAEFDVLVFRSIDRLARRVRDFNGIMDWADDNGIRLVSLSPNIDFASDVGRLIAAVLAHVAAMEAKTVRERVLGARAYMRGVARWPSGMAPYGYRLAPHPSGSGYALEHDPDTAPLVTSIVGRVLTGEPLSAIVADLNRRGVPTPRRRAKAATTRTDTRWQVSNLSRMFKSEALRGYVLYKGSLVLDANGEPVSYGPPLVDDDTWHDLQTELAKRVNPDFRRRTGRALLVGIARCATCKRSLYISGSDNRGEFKRYRYGCSGVRYGEECTSPSIYADLIEGWTERELLARVGAMSVVIREETPAVDNRAEVADVERRLARLRQDGEDGLYDDDRKAYVGRVKALQTRLEALRGESSRAGTVTETETGETYAETWERSTKDERRDLMHAAGVVVTLAPGIQGSKQWEPRLTFAMGAAGDDALAGEW
jgi:site-specific DNA recombinase